MKLKENKAFVIIAMILLCVLISFLDGPYIIGGLRALKFSFGFSFVMMLVTNLIVAFGTIKFFNAMAKKNN